MEAEYYSEVLILEIILSAAARITAARISFVTSTSLTQPKNEIQSDAESPNRKLDWKLSSIRKTDCH